MADGPSPGIGRRRVLAGLAGVGVAASGLVPLPASGESDSEAVLLGDFESGLNGWRTVGEHLLGTVAAAERPGAVTRGERALEVTVTGDLVPTIWNEERVSRADVSGHPYLVADVTPGVVSGTDSGVTFKLRYVHVDLPPDVTAGEYDLDGLPGVYESDEIAVPPLVPSRLFWDLGGLPDAALSDPRRLEIVWAPTDALPELDALATELDYRGTVVFDDVRLSEGVGAVSAARLSNVWRDLQFAHGAYLETVVTSRDDEREEGVFVFADGTLAPYAFEVLGEGAYRYEIGGRKVASGGGVVPGGADSGTGSSGGAEVVTRPRSSNAGRNSASATVLTYIPGSSENTTEGGDEYHSAMPDVSDYIDNAFHGDNRTAMEASLSEATELDKALEEYPDRLFPHYRVRNGVSVALQSSDGRRMDGEVTVRSEESSSLSPITLEGGDGEGDDNPYRANLDAHHDGEEVKDPLPREHFVSHTTFDVDGVEGVRASTIYGGVDRYIVEFLDAVRAGGPLELPSTPAAEAGAYLLDHVFALPAFYSFVELILMADGTKVARAWDAGQYPRHALYLDGALLSESDFDEGEEWRENEQVNAGFTRWGSESKIALHPYKSPHLAYENLFRAGGGPHPVLVGGEDGSLLTVDEVVEATPTPHFPF